MFDELHERGLTPVPRQLQFPAPFRHIGRSMIQPSLWPADFQAQMTPKSSGTSHSREYPWSKK